VGWFGGFGGVRDPSVSCSRIRNVRWSTESRGEWVPVMRGISADDAAGTRVGRINLGAWLRSES
jgi:hypothetical protein